LYVVNGGDAGKLLSIDRRIGHTCIQAAHRVWSRGNRLAWRQRGESRGADRPGIDLQEAAGAGKSIRAKVERHRENAGADRNIRDGLCLTNLIIAIRSVK